MATQNKSALLERILSALASGGWNYLVVARRHPFELVVYRGDDSYRTRIYIWNITPGGKNRAADEYRIQITSGVGQFALDGVERTLVLGWSEDVGVFAGFDVSRHVEPLGSSPSLQISMGTLTEAAVSGLAAYRKSNSEVALAFVPFFMGEYAARLREIHGIAGSTKDLTVLQAVVANPARAPEAIEQATSGARMKILAQIAKQLRDARFTQRVLQACGMQCAMCGVQLRIVEAAHIVPAAQINDDTTSNGLALCGSHHRAFDRSLITVMPDYTVAFNPALLVVLKASAFEGGWRAFRAALRPQIILPANEPDMPNPKRLREGNSLRGWAQYEPVA